MISMMPTDYTLIIILVSSFLHEYAAFLPAVNVRPTCNGIGIDGKQRYRARYYLSQDDNNKSSSKHPSLFSIQESTEMQQLILSLSLESSDQIRRDRLATLYEKEFSNPDNEMYERFVVLFDQTLIEMGTVIQETAKNQAMNKLQREQDEGDAASSNGSEDYMSLNRSIEERQLWAMVDMMVQSKVLAKQKINKRDDFQ